MKRFVLDASIALAWFLDDPIAPVAVRAKDSLRAGARAVVPALWHLEMANGLAVAERRAILSAMDTEEAVRLLAELATAAIETDDRFLTIPRLLTVAREYRLSSFDAAYLEIARANNLPLATTDRQLEIAAKSAGVPLFH